MDVNYNFIKGTSPIVITAIHDGHHTRQELTELFNLTDEERLREEDPFTGNWLSASDNQITVNHSRFETDVNRPRDKAVYISPEDAWGLEVWKAELPDEVIKSSQAVYDNFYKQCKIYFDHLFTIQESIIVFDIHSYNHRRIAATEVADPIENPEINIGTKNMDSEIWHPVVNTLISHFNTFDYNGRQLDARENIKFKGGYFGEWLHKEYGQKICPISIEFKKFFMDEWTGKPFEDDIQRIDSLIASSIQPVLNVLKALKK